MSLRTEILESSDAIASAAPPWRDLAELAGNPFASPEWFDAVLTDLGGTWRPAAVAVSDADRLIGVLPLLHSGRRARNVLSIAGAERADILQPAAHPDDARAVADAAAAALSEFAPKLPLMLGRVDRSLDWWESFSTTGSGRRSVVGPLDLLPFAELPDTWDEYLAARSRSFRSQLGRKMRALRKEHSVQIRYSAKPTEIATDLEVLFDLHDQRWQARAGRSAFGPPTRPFHRKFARSTAEAGWARICSIDVDGAPAAAWYGWKMGGKMLYYQAGLNPDWHRYSLGFLLLGETVHRAIDEGCGEYDMLLGDEAFKSRFADQHREGVEVTVARPFRPSHIKAEARTRARITWRRLPERSRARLHKLKR